jgi:hypothetical protein
MRPRPSNKAMYGAAAVLAAVLLYVVNAPMDNERAPAPAAQPMHGHSEGSAAMAASVPSLPLDDATAAAQQPTVDPLTDSRLTEAALAHDDDHYRLPEVMRAPADPNAPILRERIGQYLEQADAKEAELQKKLDMATLKATSHQDVARLQSELDQLRKQREDIIVKHIRVLESGFFHD